MGTSAGGFLDGTRVLDLSTAHAYTAGKILASFGADVVKVEPPGGERARTTPPCRDDGDSIYWSHHNAGKRGITLNLERADGAALLKRLAAEADILVESFTPGTLAGLGLDYTALAPVNPRLVFVSITPFGQEGPYSRFKAGELVISAMSGILTLTGDTDRAPVKEALDAHIFHANCAAANAAIMAYHHALRTGEGQHVDVSIQEVGASRNTKSIIGWQFDRRVTARTGNRQVVGQIFGRWIWGLRDGVAFFNLMSGKVGAPSNRALSAWLDEAGLVNPMQGIDWENMSRAAITQTQRDTWDEAIATLFGRYGRDEMRAEATRRGLNVCVANTAAEVLAHPQLLARDYWQGDVASHFVLSTPAANKLARAAAPRPGEHNAEVFSRLGISQAALGALEAQGVV
jgi:crotonobetainyl-CoA:carnitine CoA-transferase CaiB-like acyl-CoA transferase